MKRIRLAFFENCTVAEPTRQRLVQAGIRAEVHAESRFAQLWFVSRWRAGVRMEVPADQADRATRLLNHWDGCAPWLDYAIRCPECKSFRVHFPQFTEESILTNVTMGLIAQLGFIERQYYCEDCHYMWTRPGSKVTRIRPHLAPDYFLEDLRGDVQAGSVQSNRGGAGRRHAPRPSNKWRTRCSTAMRWGRITLRRRLLGLILPLAGTILMPGACGEVGGIEPRPPQVAVRNEPTPGVSKSPTYLSDILPIFMGKCARCHNDQTILANWLDYQTAAGKRWEIKRRVWDSWHGTYFKQPMPAANGPESAAITQQERQLIRDWVKSGAPRGVAPIFSGGLSKPEKIEMGKRLFTTICAACHQPTGLGIPGRFPPLAASDFLNADKHRAIRIVVNGLQGDLVVNGQHFNNAMPKFPLTDQDIACALTFVYNSFGNSGKEISPEEVTAARNEKPEPGAASISAAKVPEEKSPYE